MVASSRERSVFIAATVSLLAAMWLPIWVNEFPPLQDYPYHLAQVAVIVAGSEAGAPYASHFTVDLAPRPYAAFYFVASVVARALPLEVAGRVALSVPGALWGCLLLGGLRRSNAPPWGALVLLPLSVGLSYHLGFVTYLWSLPLLGLALEDQARLADGEPRSGARLALWIGALFLTHPFTFLAFLGLGALRLFCDAPLPGGRRRVSIALGVAACGFALWFVTADAGRGAAGAQGISWLPIGKSFELATLPFVGMRGGGAVAWGPLGVWLVVGAVLAFAAGSDRSDAPRRRFWGLALVLSSVAIFAAPFRMGDYSYINARIPEITFLCVGMLAGGLRLGAVSRVVLVAGVAAAIALSGIQQRRVAQELVEVAPLFEWIPEGAALLPLVFDDDSPELEPGAFDPHLHVHHYFHVRRGGGVTPYFFPHPLVPVQYRENSPPPAPPLLRPAAYRFDRHGHYDFLLVRAAPPRVLRGLARGADEIAASGPWRLFQLRRAGSALELEETPAGDG
jgi:hypothetical protein